MKIIYDRLRILTPIARSLVYTHDSWIVGGCANYFIDESISFVRDLDIIVPFYEWGLACKMVKAGTPSNSFGGFKVIDDGLEIDMWCGDIGYLIANSPQKPIYAVHPRTYTIITGNFGLEK